MTNDTQAPAEVVAAEDSQLWELVQTGEYKKVDGKDTSVRVEKVILQGTSTQVCLRFHQVCPFSYDRHRQYSYETYTIRPVRNTETESEK